MGKKPITFESFLAIYSQTISSIIRQTLPLRPAEAKLWETPERLAWIGLCHEQESFYISFSFGALKDDSIAGLKRPKNGTFDYLESSRINTEHFKGVGAHELNEAYSDLLNPGPPVAGSDDVDEEELDEAKGEVRSLAGLVAAGLFAQSWKPKMSPIQTTRDFFFTVSKDIETPTWSSSLVPCFSARDKVIRKIAIDALCGSRKMKSLFENLIELGLGRKSRDLVATIDAILSV
ncbi:MAG: hypothetical protein K8S54_02390 [Spirochaetia bacterium]|nr:hypothetical protein [Spirochaetia bacterium]